MVSYSSEENKNKRITKQIINYNNILSEVKNLMRKVVVFIIFLHILTKLLLNSNHSRIYNSIKAFLSSSIIENIAIACLIYQHKKITVVIYFKKLFSNNLSMITNIQVKIEKMKEITILVIFLFPFFILTANYSRFYIFLSSNIMTLKAK